MTDPHSTRDAVSAYRLRYAEWHHWWTLASIPMRGAILTEYAIDYRQWKTGFDDLPVEVRYQLLRRYAPGSMPAREEDGAPKEPGDMRRYRHGECGWEGTEQQMRADYAGEMWSNWICPGCGAWLRLDDYERVEVLLKGGDAPSQP